MARGSIHDAAHINKAKSYIKKAFMSQMAGEGYSCVEILSPCPTNWHMSPEESMRRIGEEVVSYYPLGEFSKGGDR